MDTPRIVLSEAEAAARIGKTTRTMQRWRADGCGPPFIRVGRNVLYPVAALAEWIAANTVRSDAEAKARDAAKAA